MRLSVLGSSRRHQKKCRAARVYLDGIEVTKDCQIADSKQGVVLLLLRDEHGKWYLTAGGDVAKTWRHGTVSIGRWVS